ncbi:hypothetical protein HBN50_05155 [Halobacteriovorax sp. GB3]|uniref:hypothetical protein n=1 Tax=Halobacteriovorax sp. GB3 TaxID=2719615 RepID=UPI0023612D19|nr:hypothetical protein [Halobacteriovorax sp. GB3]MDD0852473.1 hypothetical protein [Halobacteriovorax sp. GB3]
MSLKKTFSALLLFSLSQTAVLATPAFCKFYENLEISAQRESVREKYGEVILHKLESKGIAHQFRVNDLLDNYYQAFKYKKIENSKHFSSDLTIKALEKASSAQEAYYGVSNLDLDESIVKDVYQCIQSNNKLKELSLVLPTDITEDKEISDAFISNLFFNALRVKYFLDLRNKLELQKKKRLSDLLVRSSGRGYYQINKKAERREDIEKEFDPKIAVINDTLIPIFQSSPLLFEYENDFDIADWVNIKIVASELTKRLLDGLSTKFLSEAMNSLENSGSIVDLSSVILSPSYQVVLDNHVLGLINSKKFKSEIKDYLSDYLNGIREGMLELCESNGENLHHNDSLVKAIFDDNIYDKNFDLQMAKDQGAYCHLVENYPREEIGSFSWKTGVGLSMMALGGISQLFVGVGNIVGTGLIATGGAILTGESIHNAYLASKSEKISEVLNIGGWEDYKSVIEMKNIKTDLLSDSGTDAVLTVATAGIGKLIKHSAKSRVYTAEESAMNTKFSRVKRGETNQELIIRQDGEAYLTGLWNRHEYYEKSYELRVDKFKTKRKTAYLMDKNRSKLPAFHVYGESGEETLGILSHVSNKELLDSEDGAEALKKVQKWMDDYSSYRDEISVTVDKGMQSFDRIKELEKALEEFNYESFENGKAQIVNLTKFKDGKRLDIKEKYEFQSLNELKEELRKEKTVSTHSFARNGFEELSTKSRLYDVMDMQAVDYRRLEFLRDELKKAGSRSELSKAQNDILVKTESLLADSKLRPRRDALDRLEKKEFKAELRDFIRGLRSKEKLLSKMQFKLTGVAKEQFENTGFVGKHFKTLLIANLGLVSTNVTYRYLESGGSLAELAAKSNINLNKVVRFINQGYTLGEEKCAASGRSFSFMLCFNELAKEEVGIELARAKVKDHSYQFRNDPKVIKKVTEYAHRMISLKKKVRGAELFNLTNSILSLHYAHNAVHEFSALVGELNPKHPEIASDIAYVLTGKDQTEVEMRLHLIDNKYRGKYIDIIKEFVSRKKEIVSAITESGRLPHDLENKIRGLDYDEAEYSIIDDEFNLFNQEILKEVGESLDVSF